MTIYLHCFLSEVPLIPTVSYNPLGSFRMHRKHLHFYKALSPWLPRACACPLLSTIAPIVYPLGGSQPWRPSESPGGLVNTQIIRPCPGVWFNRSEWALRVFISNKSPGDVTLLVQGSHSENHSLLLDYMLVSLARLWLSWSQGTFLTYLIFRVSPVSSSHSIGQQIFIKCLLCARHCWRH